MKTALAIGFVFIVIGLPLWWKTTTTYRAFLPHASIETLASHKIFINIPVNLVLCHKKNELEDDGLSQQLEDILMKGKTPGRSFTVQYSVKTEKCRNDQFQAVQQVVDTEVLEELFETSSSELELILLPRTQEQVPFSVYVGRSNQVFAFFKPNDDDSSLRMLGNVTSSVLVNEESLMKSYAVARGYTIRKADREIMRAVKSTPGYELSFSLLNPDPSKMQATWDIESAINDFLQPFLDKLSSFAKFTISSQVLYYTNIAVKPKKSKDGHYYLPAEKLPLVINPVEARLESPVSTDPTINFLVYVPTVSQSPLYIYNEQGERSDMNAFFSPRWGGFFVQNSSPSNTSDDISYHEVNMKPAMEVFLSQLRMLLGIPNHPSMSGVFLGDTDETAITDWEMAILLRKRTLENIGTASASLFSLSRLLDKVNNMVITDEIAKEVYQAVNYLEICHEHLASGDMESAYVMSKKAIASSEKAFFDPSLLELLYFPEDQKFAIYIPLFLPIGLPIISSLFKAIRWWRETQKVKVD